MSKVFSIFIALMLVSIYGCGEPAKKIQISKPQPLLKIYLKRNSVLEDNNIISMYNENDSTLWIATKSAIYKKESGNIQKAPESLSDKISGEKLTCISGDNKGTIFIGTDTNIYIWINKRNLISHMTGRVNTIFWDKKRNTLMVGTNNGLLKFNNSKWEHLDAYNSVFSIYKKDKNLGQDFLKVRSIVTDDSLIWIGTGDGLIMMDGKKSRTFYAAHKRPGPDNHLTLIPGNSELAGNKVNSIVIFDNKKWIGTGSGISAFSSIDNFWELYTSDHLELSDINGKWVDKKVKGNSPLIGNWINDMLIIDNKLYIATTKGLSIFNITSNKWKKLNKDNGMINQQLQCLAEFKGKLYAGSIYGLYEINLKVLNNQKGDGK